MMNEDYVTNQTKEVLKTNKKVKVDHKKRRKKEMHLFGIWFITSGWKM